MGFFNLINTINTICTNPKQLIVEKNKYSDKNIKFKIQCSTCIQNYIQNLTLLNGIFFPVNILYIIYTLSKSLLLDDLDRLKFGTLLLLFITIVFLISLLHQFSDFYKIQKKCLDIFTIRIRILIL